MCAPLYNQGGVTLIETVVALGLFAIAVATMGSFLTRQIRHAASNNHHTIAYSIAEEQLESMRALKFADMYGSSEQFQKGDLTFDVVTTVHNSVPAPNMKAVTVDVSWNEPGGTKNVSLQTVYTAIRR